jgi:hypothetical protein
VEQRSSASGLTAESCITGGEYRERVGEFYSSCAKTKTCVVFNFDVEGK